MSLNVAGIVSAVQVADEGFYYDDEGVPRSVERSGRMCKGLRFNLVLGTSSGNLMTQNTINYSCLGIVSDSTKVELLTLEGILNFGGIVASEIAKLSNGVILGLSSDFGLYRPDEQFRPLGGRNDTLLIGLKKIKETRSIDGVDREVFLTFPSEFMFKVPFLGSAIGSSLIDNLNVGYSDSFFISNNISGKVDYKLGYLKFENNDKDSIVGVVCDEFFQTKIVSESNLLHISYVNNDSEKGCLVPYSSSYSSAGTVISEKF